MTVEVGTVTSIDVIANDRDPDGNDADLELVSSTAPTLGTATRTGNTITFAAGNVVGNTTINYQVADAGEGQDARRVPAHGCVDDDAEGAADRQEDSRHKARYNSTHSSQM